MTTSPQTFVYTFRRVDGFYPLELRSDEEAIANAKCNPGTLEVINEITGVVVFSDSQNSKDQP